jgi:hypothetical protein
MRRRAPEVTRLNTASTRSALDPAGSPTCMGLNLCHDRVEASA